MTLPDEFFEIPLFGRIQCKDSQSRAPVGFLNEESCAAMQRLAVDKCGCEPQDGGGSVRSSMEVTSNAEGGMFSASKLVVNLGLSFAVASVWMSNAN
jgi:hypothetical protein